MVLFQIQRFPYECCSGKYKIQTLLFSKKNYLFCIIFNFKKFKPNNKKSFVNDVNKKYQVLFAILLALWEKIYILLLLKVSLMPITFVLKKSYLSTSSLTAFFCSTYQTLKLRGAQFLSDSLIPPCRQRTSRYNSGTKL